MQSTYLSSTIVSDNNRNDHLAKPLGGLLQHKLTNFASTSPSTFFSYTRCVSRRSITASSPSSINLFFTLSIVRIPTFNTLLICSFVTFSEYFPSSQFKRMYAVL